MSSGVEEHVISRVANATMRDSPFPHLYVEKVFPDDFYAQIRLNWPNTPEFTSISESGRVSKGLYAERFVLPFTPSGIERLQDDRRIFWKNFGNWFLAYPFMEAVIDKFVDHARKRFGDNLSQTKFEVDSLLIQDLTNYSIGPHTDSKYRLLSMLFYCPENAGKKHLGTSIYVPLDPSFRCEGGRHYKRDQFRLISTFEYKPNTLLAFFKTDNSFHGVEPITELGVQRDLLLYDIRVCANRRVSQTGNVHSPASWGGLGLKMLKKVLGTKQR